MASRALLFASFVLVAVALPAAQAQLGQIVISGTVPCSTGGTVVTSTTPVFPNATVQLVCGNSVISSAVTNGNGVFVMVLSPLVSLLSSLLNTCRLVVSTPLSSCNPALPANGFLQATLQQISGGLLGGILGDILNLIPKIFSLI